MIDDLLGLADPVGPVHLDHAAAALDVPRRRLRSTVLRQGWRRSGSDVVLPPGLPMTPQLRARAAVLQLTGPDPGAPRPVAVGRWSGAHLLGVGIGSPRRVQVYVPVDRAPRQRVGELEVIRTRTWADERVATHEGVAVVSPAWLVRTCAPVATPGALRHLVIDLVQQRHTSLDEIVAEHDRWPRYPGRRALGELLERLHAAGRTDSPLELEARERLLAAGIPLDHGQVTIPCADGRPIHRDLGIAACCFAIELVSMLGHGSRRQLLADVRRSNAAATVDADWRVLQATLEDLHSGWDPFVTLVREVVSAQAQRHLGVPWPRPEDVVPAPAGRGVGRAAG